MRFHSILVLSGALAAAPALIFGCTPPDYPNDLTMPFPKDIGSTGAQFQRYYNGSLSVADMGLGAGSFGAMCGLDARLDMSLNFTGARPANNGCDCDFHAQAAEIYGYPTKLLATASSTSGTPTYNDEEHGINCVVRPKTTPAALTTTQPAPQTQARPRQHAQARARNRRPVHAARLEKRRQPARNTTGTAAREAPETAIQQFHPTPVQWAFLGGLGLIVVGAISMLFRRSRFHRL